MRTSRLARHPSLERQSAAAASWSAEFGGTGVPDPPISQFRADSPRCGDTWNGGAVAVTEAILRRYRPDEAIESQQSLGRSMAVRHRRADPSSRHGICPTGWCTFCSYLELKARHVAVGYGRLDVAQLRAHAILRHAIHLEGWYAEIRTVGPSGYGPTVPARGRSDTKDDGRFRQAIVVWGAGRLGRDGLPQTYIVGDPNFGAPTRPGIPPYCEYLANDVESFYSRGGGTVAYCLGAPAPPGIGATTPEPGAEETRFGAIRTSPRWFEVNPADGGRLRRTPFVRPDNVIRLVPKETRFRAAQATLAGTNVRGSTTWWGDETGLVWMHESVLRPVEEGTR